MESFIFILRPKSFTVSHEATDGWQKALSTGIAYFQASKCFCLVDIAESIRKMREILSIFEIFWCNFWHFCGFGCNTDYPACMYCSCIISSLGYSS